LRTRQYVYFVKVDNKIIKLQSPTFYSVKLTAYASDMANWQIACGKVKKENLAVINYRPTKYVKEHSTDELVSIEFVPDNFKFLN
jgi:hypothetical protein